MKIGLAIGCLSICLVAFTDTNAQEDGLKFPYQALVVAKSAEVFSGPASVHYSTDQLEQGAIVDVYRHDPGGWCAIRPPIGSFSLLPESAVAEAGEGLGRINEDGIKAWVGTRLGAVEKPLWQVKMKKDEVVQILGEVSWPHPDGHSTIWYQIAPPAGEFRWIQISDIQPPKNVSDLPDLQSGSSGSQISSSYSNDRSRMRPASFQSEDPVFDDTISLDPPSVNDATVNRGWRQARTPIRVADRRNEVTASAEPFKIPAIDGPSKVDPTNLPVSLTSNTTRQDSVSRLALAAGAANVALNPLSGPVSQRIRMLESSLTAEMLKTPSDWELESILRQATSIASSSNIQTEQQHAQRLTTKIRKCVAIQAKFDSAFNGKSSVQSNSIAQLGNQPVGAGIDNNVEFGTTYDAHGWLNQLVRGKGSLQPTYVIEDDAGRILYHVAASPGLNLNRYLKNKVGVIGRRGFHRELQLDHVTAERIVVIDSLRR